MTEVTVAGAARDWLAGQGGEVTLRLSTRHGCCGGQAGVPVAEPGAPRNADGYTAREIDGVRVFVADDLGAGPYHIDVEGLFRWRRLVVEGAMGQSQD
ncbi:CC/Se motif family (seleno)protein [Thioalkalivibrio sp. ALMg11]|uniref:CC/Se motif family (seleno)protein n=1 Tax=Thioalkalivibrio sp. ALMg11 TaxID=1158165 RepID=UPI00037F42E7|nr:CC/Se motif family (seleno)protein [Thioalkalivibrio sp. ALMg11]